MHRTEQPPAVGELLREAETSLRSGRGALTAQSDPTARLPPWEPNWKPEKVIDRLFIRLTNNYTQAWTSQFNAPTEEDGLLRLAMTKAEWGADLAAFSNDEIGEAIRLAKRRHPDYPPKLPQFVELCKTVAATTPEPRTLPEPRLSAERVAGHIARMRAALNGTLPPREAQAAKQEALDRMDHKMPDPRREVARHE